MKKGILRKRIIGLFLVGIMLCSMTTPSFASRKGNEYPIVLVNGFSGWGRDELAGYKYWGGFIDLQEELTDSGHETYTGTVSPFSSNWDRACELYAYIKGGTVDYGEAHSTKYNHERYGRYFEGIYPEWGELDRDDQIKKIHLIGHSMGGQTIRMLVQLLAEGSEEERIATTEGLSPLFEGNKSWVNSVTTISSPHDGTTLADGVNMLKNLGKDMIIAFATIAGCTSQPVYDFKLDQWGISKDDYDDFYDYSKKVYNSSVWDSSNKDFSIWDLSTDGASEINGWVKAQPDVYYFSYTTAATKERLFSDKHIPLPIIMNSLFIPTSTFIGRYTRDESDRVTIDEEWFENDGVVNAISQNGPKINSTDEIVEYDGDPEIGKWNDMGILKFTDHGDIVGTFGYVTDWYMDLAENLQNLPQ
jgi:triacylglycerol lipase